MTKLISPSCPAQDCPLRHRCYRYVPMEYDEWLDVVKEHTGPHEIRPVIALMEEVKRQQRERWVATTCEFFVETQAIITVEPLVTRVN